MGTTCLRKLILFLSGITIVFYYSSPISAALITDIRSWSAPDHTRVVLDLTEPVQYESSSVDKPPQFHLELKEVNLFTKKRIMEVNDPYLFKIILSDLGEEKVKLIFYQKKSLNVNIFPLKPYLDKPHRLVIDLIDPAQEKKEEEERQRQKAVRPEGAKTIVVDPGHGGEDPGAIGPRKTMEKDIVLMVGQKVVHLLNQTKGFQAFLTRKTDYFIPLEDRIKIAREYGADLFISLHADASFNPQARGSSVYCLSLSGATDQAAKILADQENMSNLLGGASSSPASIAKDPNLDKILLDLMQNNSMKESFRFAECLLENFKAVNHLKYSSYRQASFIVLKAPDIPSVLLEIAYITNKGDERLLKQSGFQERVAKALASSIERYCKE
jgi:N-acetylmuramoyl-L-alanine amidase